MKPGQSQVERPWKSSERGRTKRDDRRSVRRRTFVRQEQPYVDFVGMQISQRKKSQMPLQGNKRSFFGNNVRVAVMQKSFNP